MYDADTLKLAKRLYFETKSLHIRGLLFWQNDNLLLWGDREIHSLDLNASSEASASLRAGDVISGLSVISRAGGDVLVVVVGTEACEEGCLQLYDTSLKLEDRISTPLPLISRQLINCTAAVNKKRLSVYYVTHKLELGSVVWKQ